MPYAQRSWFIHQLLTQTQHKHFYFERTTRNELLGLEGMVKLKNPDDMVLVVAVPTTAATANHSNASVSGDSKVSASVSFENEKRYVKPVYGFDKFQSNNRICSVSNAPHRSLPDIPVSEPPSHAVRSTLGVGVTNGGGNTDNGSDLYATVGDKTQTDKELLDRRCKFAICLRID